jgi:hypothetical protein
MALGQSLKGTVFGLQDSPYLVLALSVAVLSVVLYVIYTVMTPL